MKIGHRSLLDSLPRLIQIQDRFFILAKKSDGEPVLYDATCPHQHGVVNKLESGVWRCPNHNWIFNPMNGQSINSPQSNLQKFSVEQNGEFLFSNLPMFTNPTLSTSNTAKGPKITLVSNACLLIEWNGYRILTDPWIEGSAFFDSWIQYPPSGIKVSDLPKIDMIWISHGHSDHLHYSTLSLFDKEIPVMIPKFKTSRLMSILRSLGFQKIIEMPSYELFSVSNDIQLMSFKSGSIWNDSILYLRFGDFSILNFNDAGYNENIKNCIDSVDLICSAYSQGASGYPLTWTHLDENSKMQIMNQGNVGMLNMIKQLVEMFSPRYFIPIAAFNELYQPCHLKYEKLRVKNSLKTVIRTFESSPVRVLDMIPGESWDGQTDIIKRRVDREKFFDKEFLYNYLKLSYEQSNKNTSKRDFSLTHKEIEKYFDAFNNSEIVHKIGNMRIYLSIRHESRHLSGLISFHNGTINYKPIDRKTYAEMTMNCPGLIAQEIIRKDLSWDEAHIGYWCSFSRNPDTYNIYLWQLLYAPWEFRQKSNFNELSVPETILLKSSIADLIEKKGKTVTDILEKFGLYCSGCYLSVGETISDGCRIHGISPQKANELINELKRVI